MISSTISTFRVRTHAQDGLGGFIDQRVVVFYGLLVCILRKIPIFEELIISVFCQLIQYFDFVLRDKRMKKPKKELTDFDH